MNKVLRFSRYMQPPLSLSALVKLFLSLIFIELLEFA